MEQEKLKDNHQRLSLIVPSTEMSSDKSSLSPLPYFLSQKVSVPAAADLSLSSVE